MRSRVALCLVAIAVATAVVGCSSNTGSSQGGEVFLAVASDLGPDPFTPNAANPAVGLGPASSASPSAGSPGQITSVTGTSKRTYAGSATASSCDKKLIQDSLTSDPAKAQAWAGVIGIDVKQILAYLAGAAATVLRSDTRVTNHTLVNGQARPFQYVLQAGTAVLVDSNGLPRVRCACGNPLAPPTAISGAVTYVGTKWNGFDPSKLVVIVSGPPQTHIIVVNVTDGSDLSVPVSTPSSSGTASPGVTPGGTVTPGTASPAGYENCSRRYAELVRDLTLAHKLTPADAQRWAASAQEAAESARSGNLTRAYEICAQTVSEMEAALAG